MKSADLLDIFEFKLFNLMIIQNKVKYKKTNQAFQIWLALSQVSRQLRPMYYFIIGQNISLKAITTPINIVTGRKNTRTIQRNRSTLVMNSKEKANIPTTNVIRRTPAKMTISLKRYRVKISGKQTTIMSALRGEHELSDSESSFVRMLNAFIFTYPLG